MQFDCLNCNQPFECQWEFADVTCTHCGAVLETEYETDGDDNICGPWLTKIISVPENKPGK